MTPLPVSFLILACVVATVAFPAATVEAAPQDPTSEGAASSRPASLVIERVYLISGQGAAQNALVNLVIHAGALVLVTRDEVPPDTAELTVDGGEGYVLGDLSLGSPANLMILDRDPMADVAILLDTRQYARFALREGVIVLNELPTTAAEPDSTTPAFRWRAYTPPPLAVPLHYGDSRKWNRFDTRIVSGLFNGAVALEGLNWLSQDQASEEQVGDLTPTEGGEIRALRVGVVGQVKLPQPWTYTVYVAFKTFDKGFDATEDDEILWYDYRLDIPLGSVLNLSVGKQKPPISMERLMPLNFLEHQERSAPSDTLLQARNFGVALSGTGLSERFTWAGGVFNGWIDSGTSFSDTPTEAVGRVTWLPLATDDDSNLLHLGLGLRYSGPSDSMRYRARPELDQAPFFIDTGVFGADNSLTSNLEAYWRWGPSFVGFEYNATQVAAPDLEDPRFSGWHLSGSWALTGEMRAYRRHNGVFGPLVVARPIHEGGWGAWEAAFRYTTLDLDGGLIEGGAMDIWSVALNWWLTQASQASVSYRVVGLDRFEATGWSSGLNIRLALILD